MAGSFKFAILRLAPHDVRREVLNVGIMVYGQTKAEFHFSKGLDKVKALSRALEIEEITSIANSIVEIYSSFAHGGDQNIDAAISLISSMGPLRLDRAGEFSAENDYIYRSRIGNLLSLYVDPEPATRKAKEKKSRVLTDIKRAFRAERVLAKKHEDLSSHRVVSSVEIDEGLVADLVLRNGALHVTETVDASSSDTSLRKIISDLGVSSLVLERAKMTFVDLNVKSTLVYTASSSIERSVKPALDAAEHLGAHLVNWNSDRERRQYIQGLVALAVPYEEKNKHRQSIVGGRFNFH